MKMGTTYTREDQKEALKLAEEIGVTGAAQRLGISLKTLYSWRKKATAYKGPVSKTGEPLSVDDSRAEITRLAKENATLKQEVEILQEALGFFVERRKK